MADRSHRPHHHPNEHTQEELKLIADMRKRNANENSLKRCMAAVHLTLYQEMCSLKRELDAETKDPLWSEPMRSPTVQSTGSASGDPASKSHKGGGSI